MTKAVMGVRRFRETFPSLTEPTEVIRATKGMERLGVWYPSDQRTTYTATVSSGPSTTPGTSFNTSISDAVTSTADTTADTGGGIVRSGTS